MIPLSVVTQGRYDPYTVVHIDESSEQSINLLSQFIKKIGREPRANESIRYVVTPGTVLVGDLANDRVTPTTAALYTFPQDFSQNTNIIIENRGRIHGKGGNGRSQNTILTSGMLEQRGAYKVTPSTRQHGGHGIVNTSPAKITVHNYGILTSGGGGGGALGPNSYIDGDAIWGGNQNLWYCDLLVGGGGGGAPYGAGGHNSNRTIDFTMGSYENVMSTQDQINTAIFISRMNPAVIRPIGPAPRLAVYDMWDSLSTAFQVPLPDTPNNYLPINLVLFGDVTSPAGSAHYNRYASEINGPNKHRLYFNKSIYSIKNGGSKYKSTETLGALSPPKFIGDKGSLEKGGGGGYGYTEHIASRTVAYNGYVPATGGVGGDMGRPGEEATEEWNTKMYSLGKGSQYTVKTIGKLRDEGVRITSEISFLGFPNIPPGNPGVICSGNIKVENMKDGKCVGRLDISALSDVLKQFGTVNAIRKFKILLGSDDGVLTKIQKVTMLDALSNAPEVDVDSYTTGIYSGSTSMLLYFDALQDIVISKSKIPGTGNEYLFIHSYGIYEGVTSTSTTLTVPQINYAGHVDMNTTRVDLSILPVILVAAPPNVIAAIRDYINNLGLIKGDWFATRPWLY